MTKQTKTTHTSAHAAHEDSPPAPAAATPAASPPVTAPEAASAGLGAGAITPPGTTASPSSPPGPGLLTMALAQAQQSVAAATAAVAQAQAHLPGLVALPEAQRKTAGRLRDGEGSVYLTILAACATNPQLVASLADEDNGVDPNTFETELLSSRVQLAILLQPLSASLTQLASSLDDTVLYLNGLTRGPTLEAYAILKAVAKTDVAVKTALAPALDFYSNIAKASAATRKKNAAAKAAALAAAPAVTAPATVAAQVGAAAPAGGTTAK